jgi:hypothetical protein
MIALDDYKAPIGKEAVQGTKRKKETRKKQRRSLLKIGWRIKRSRWRMD